MRDAIRGRSLSHHSCLVSRLLVALRSPILDVKRDGLAVTGRAINPEERAFASALAALSLVGFGSVIQAAFGLQTPHELAHDAAQAAADEGGEDEARRVGSGYAACLVFHRHDVGRKSSGGQPMAGAHRAERRQAGENPYARCTLRHSGSSGILVVDGGSDRMEQLCRQAYFVILQLTFPRPHILPMFSRGSQHNSADSSEYPYCMYV